ncbi:MAG: hypothetical protein L0Y72_26185 [Gemmataceae bacterium]|nr:hypothetical protein [Gemmataceae bacterium]
MRMKIVILEDNEARQQKMRESLADRLHTYEPVIFAKPKEMVQFLGQHLAEVIAISLDHDLELVPDRNGWVDPGNGREIADYLSTKSPSCPVVIHTTNSQAAAGMELVLNEAGWTTLRVAPFGDTEWIPSAWLKAMRRVILDRATPIQRNS